MKQGEWKRHADGAYTAGRGTLEVEVYRSEELFPTEYPNRYRGRMVWVIESTEGFYETRDTKEEALALGQKVLKAG